MIATLPPWLLLDPLLTQWLQEDMGRGDRTTAALFPPQGEPAQAHWVAKAEGAIAGLTLAARVFHLLDPYSRSEPQISEGATCTAGQTLITFTASPAALLTGERVALNLAMRLSGIATATAAYVAAIAPFPAQFVDTRKTTPGLRLLEKYATQVGGGLNHRMGLDDAVMLKDNHIQAAGGIGPAIAQVRRAIPYPLTVEVETSNLIEVEEAIAHGADIIMLDNMNPTQMAAAVALIRAANDRIKIEASGNITLNTIGSVAATGVDYISSSATITRSPWLDISMRWG
ncbi:MAG: carboxylating nicotinate-nucleotide diphosphorylase [Spirulina sp. DLM2.Bin59]|nr:MAG: carboxylating nicotinate-nucleotide diphosphorylase [Spirulina sp. DLM2.Bin59]